MNAQTPADAADQTSEILRRNEQAMMAAIFNACDDAARTTDDELRSAGINPISMRDGYFLSVALHLLFLNRCGADMETSEGGDPKRAAHLLRVGRRISAYRWEGIDEEQKTRRSDIALDDDERRELADGAQRAAFKRVMRALVDHASTADPDLCTRITADIETYITRLAPQSETDRYFAERLRESVAVLLQPPED
ncbi:hypothetical protein DFI02_112103 [Rhizobium sp. PP-F2F-G20b]|nr:hypothetical protein C8J32_1159 [Rhizobium sp. PP-CC-3A-592]PYE41340.1 hypothetical protein DFI02_112103 [Rhizobium sp. PP-F2F-G20b]